jgi:hypothetical protein
MKTEKGKNNQGTNLHQQLVAATSEDAVKKLLETAKTFKYASRETRNAWINTANRKLATFKK